MTDPTNTKDPLSEFRRLREETAAISAQMRATPPLLNIDPNSTNVLLRHILDELKEMRVEMKEMKEKQKKIEEDVAKNGEILDAQVAVVVEIKSFQEDVNLNLNSIKEKIYSNSNNTLVKIGQLKCQPTIKDIIHGKWQNIKESSKFFSVKFENDIFTREWHNGVRMKCKLNGDRCEGKVLTIKDEKIIFKEFENEEEARRWEHYMEDERLVLAVIRRGKFEYKDLFKRVGDPEFDCLFSSV